MIGRRALFPPNVVFNIDANQPAPHATVIDAATGQLLDGVVAVSFEMKARQTGLPMLTITMEGAPFSVRAPAKYELDRPTLERIAADNGFKIVEAD